ncbi:uncharacterized protein LOC127044675 [Gopherus flavomarginatus]|uniref:uncharacterized protein LOC127044675 n=1 Tax=Gopherus flavomarginatus TaxID=286002 RepID=UPI0021CC3989|nr:uncharacterized protein LOC127044675 [Gopherus flavomarginatus]
MVKLKFRMVSLGTIISSLDPGDWYVALDMQDAYFHIAIFPQHRRFLRFVIDRHHYQFAVLPFGLSPAPRVFTKCMAVVVAYLRRSRIHVFPYLDDWLIRGTSESQVLNHVRKISRLFGDLGLIINVGKSTLLPTQRIEFIGAILDSTLARAILPLSRFQTLLAIIRRLQVAPLTSIRTLVQVYTPTTDYDDEKIEDFYNQLQDIIDKVHKKDILIVQRDWNAKVGTDAQADWRDYYDPFCNAVTNERGLRLLEFAS